MIFLVVVFDLTDSVDCKLRRHYSPADSSETTPNNAGMVHQLKGRIQSECLNIREFWYQLFNGL